MNWVKDRTSINEHDEQSTKSKVAVISNPTYSWIFKYVYDLDNVYLSKDTVQNELTDESTDIIIIADGGLERLIASDSNDKKLEKTKAVI